MRTGPVRIILANDAELIIEGLKGLLAPYPDRIEIVATAIGDPKILRESLVEDDVDVMLIDAFGRSGAGIDAVSLVLQTDPSFAVAVFTEVEDLRHLFSALRLGINGYLLKSMSTEDLVSCLERIADGETVIDPKLATEAAMVAARSTARLQWAGSHLGLSRREAEVLQAIAKGHSIDEVGAQLSVGRETIRSHLQQIYRKLGVNDRAAAVAKAWREGLGS